MPDEPQIDYCERCGEAAEGKYKLMVYHSLFRLPGREYHCYRCLKVMRIYAIIGFLLMALVVTALCITTFLLVSSEVGS
jgi:hypothetical protein